MMTSSSTHNIFNTSPLYFSVTGMKDIFAFCLLLSWFVCSWPRPMSVQQTVPANGNEAAEHSLRWRRFFEMGKKCQTRFIQNHSHKILWEHSNIKVRPIVWNKNNQWTKSTNSSRESFSFYRFHIYVQHESPRC